MATTVNNFEFDQLGIGSMLQRHRLRVPPYQRDYAWTSSEVSSYLQDITLSIQTDAPQYFLGTIVTIKRGNDDLEVVDGQQRLATTALIFSAMRVLAGESNANLKTLLSSFLSSIDTSTLNEETQISLNLADSEVFKSLVVTGESGISFIKTRESHILLREAFHAAKSHLESIAKTVSSNDVVKIFQQWIEFFTHKAKVILLRVADDASAFTMFETLNDRGLSVSQADLIKNYVFSESAENIKLVQQHWTAIKSTLETVDDGNNAINFIWHALIATGGYVEQKKIYDRVKTKIKGKNSSVTELSNWEKLSKYYVGIFNPNGMIWADYPSNTKRGLEVLDLFAIQPFRPILMACSVHMPKQELPLCFNKLIAIGVRLIVASRTTTQSVLESLSEAAFKVWNKEITSSTGLVAFLLPIIPNDDRFRSAFEVATVSKAKFARYYLRSIEQVAKDEKEPWFIPNENSDKINLEHILPLSPQNNWPSFTEDQVDTYAKRIGNMALVQATTNSKIGNESFEEKKLILAQSPYETTSMISGYSSWDTESISARQKKLADLSLKAWPLK